ncbi:MAG: glycosyltransferase family 39 protein [Anaerolineales bacterium]|nr:glycosyltransferase family 39 protein [Anaerolineales bacterium]
MTNPEKRPYFVMFLLLLVLIPHLVIATHNANTVLDWYTTDDAFYYFQAARNIAAGNGVTFDGLTRTNGFHPLWMAICVPVFALARVNTLLPLRVLVVVLGLLNAGSGIVLYRLGKRYFAPVVAALLALCWSLTPVLHTMTTKGGVEAGLNAFFILLLWERLSAFNDEKFPVQRGLRQIFWLGVISTLAILSRLDNVFIVFFGGAWLWLRWWQPQVGESASARDKWLWRFKTGTAFFAPVVVVMLAYLAWNQLAFGTPMPISGQIKVWWGTLDKTVYGFPIKHFETFWGQFFTADEDLGPWSTLTAPLYAAAENVLPLLGMKATVAARRVALVGIGGGLALLAGVLVWFNRRFVLVAVKHLGLVPFFLACFAQISYYKIGHSMAQQPWYWIMQLVFMAFVLGILLESLYRLVSRIREADGLGQRIAQVVFVLACVALTLNFLDYMRRSTRPDSDPSAHFYVDRPAWVEANTEPGARIAITGAGNLGYFTAGRTIINLDGLMNSTAYFEHLKAGTGAQYLAELGVDYIFGNPYMMEETNPYAPMLAGKITEYKRYHFGERELVLWKFTP